MNPFRTVARPLHLSTLSCLYGIHWHPPDYCAEYFPLSSVHKIFFEKTVTFRRNRKKKRLKWDSLMKCSMFQAIRKISDQVLPNKRSLSVNKLQKERLEPSLHLYLSLVELHF
jgi:hypothetical protein